MPQEGRFQGSNHRADVALRPLWPTYHFTATTPLAVTSFEGVERDRYQISTVGDEEQNISTTLVKFQRRHTSSSGPLLDESLLRIGHE